MSFQEQETTSWFTRIKNAFFGIILGSVFFIGSFFLLVWNEKNSVETFKSLQEGQSIVRSITADNVNTENNGKLVHVAGFATTDETLVDPDFNISLQAIKLKRNVEMYQWQEEKKSETHKNVGGSETTTHTYSYNKVWSGSAINSSNFKQADDHQNPTEWKYKTETWRAKDVKLNAFSLSESQISELNNDKSFAVEVSSLPENIKDSVKSVSSGYYIGDNPQSPQIGDIKISYTVVKPEDVTIVAKQVNDTFEPYHADAGGTINMIDPGIHSSEYMFAEAFERNEWMTWGIRLGGFILMWVGLVLIFQLLSVLADVLPFLGDLIAFGVGLLAGVVAFGLSIITIALAWIGFHPIIGGSLLGAGLLILFGSIYLKKRRRAMLLVKQGEDSKH